ncbi:hypothetical protein BDV19DRAFT_386023 [Aspergillus venezuelensis]
MIDAANRDFASDSNVEFHVADCAKSLGCILGERRFDVVLAMWLLNYAGTPQTLTAMWASIYMHRKPDGRCIGIIPNLGCFTGIGKGGGREDVGERFGSRMQIIEYLPGGMVSSTAVRWPSIRRLSLRGTC